MEFGFDLENPLANSFDENFPSLFQIENDHMPSKTYLQSLNADNSRLTLRIEIISLIVQFARNFDPFLAFLAINYFDRYLSIRVINEWKPWIPKLVATSCISLALKMRNAEGFVSALQDDEGFLFNAEAIEKMERLIIGALEWRMRSINPFCFLNYFISLFNFKDGQCIQALKKRATEIILKAQKDVNLLEFKASVISASALLTAAHELFPMQLGSFREAISVSANVNMGNLDDCYYVIQDVAREGGESVQDMVENATPSAYVLTSHCFSSSFSDSLVCYNIQESTKSSCEVREAKRQKTIDRC